MAATGTTENAVQASAAAKEVADNMMFGGARRKCGRKLNVESSLRSLRRIARCSPRFLIVAYGTKKNELILS